MIDNLPYYTKDIESIKSAYSNSDLVHIKNEEMFNKITGEAYYIYKRKYLNLALIFKLNSIKEFQELTVRGSVHKLFNKGLHNANNFTFKDLENTLTDLSISLGIDLSKCYLLPPEYGTNLYLSEFSGFDAKEIVLNALCEQRKVFQFNVPGINTSVISGSYKNEVRLKVYSKSDDCPEFCSNTLRIETQQKKIRDFQKNGIVKITDLFILQNQIFLFNKHIKYLQNIVFFDYTIELPKDSKYKSDLLHFKNKNNWLKLIEDCKNNKVYNTKYNDTVNLLNFLSNKYGSKLLSKLVQETENQWIKSLGLCTPTPLSITRKPKDAPVRKPKNAPLYNTCMKFNLSHNFSLVDYHTLINQTNKKSSSKPPSKKAISKRQIKTSKSLKLCRLTRLDISMQKANSILLSHTGLKYYYATDRQKFWIVYNKYLSKKWINADFDKQIKELAHNIRNKHHGCKTRNNYSENNLFRIAN